MSAFVCVNNRIRISILNIECLCWLYHQQQRQWYQVGRDEAACWRVLMSALPGAGSQSPGWSQPEGEWVYQGNCGFKLNFELLFTLGIAFGDERQRRCVLSLSFYRIFTFLRNRRRASKSESWTRTSHHGRPHMEVCQRVCAAQVGCRDCGVCPEIQFHLIFRDS